MHSHFRPAIVLFLLLTAITGIAYPLAVTGAAQVAFPRQANGSLILAADGKSVIGSQLIGQPFAKPAYFWSRPSACAKPYDPQASGGSNKSPVGDEAKAGIAAAVGALQKADPGNKAQIPQDLVTASASGLDPHISPEAALYQVHRVAKARGMGEEALKQLVAAHTEQPQFGLLGGARVNVLALNLALDAQK